MSDWPGADDDDYNDGGGDDNDDDDDDDDNAGVQSGVTGGRAGIQ